MASAASGHTGECRIGHYRTHPIPFITSAGAPPSWLERAGPATSLAGMGRISVRPRGRVLCCIRIQHAHCNL